MNEWDEVAQAMIKKHGPGLQDLMSDDLRRFVQLEMPGESAQLIDNVVQAIKEYHP